jgi:uncharacterized membrane protein
MSRAEFIASLEQRLRHLPAGERNAILADYQRYFDDGISAGRSEDHIAGSLGSPARLAAELSIVNFDAAGATAPRSAARTLLSLLALAVLDGVAWLPLVIGLLGVLLATVGGVVALVYGVVTLVIGPFDQPLGGFPAVLLRALAYLSGGVASLALARAGVLLLARLFVRRQRHLRRLLRPSTEVSS